MTAFSVSLSWNPPPVEQQNGFIRQYIVSIVQTEIGLDLRLTSNITEVTVGDLQPSYEYTCRVAAQTVGVGPFSEDIQVILPESGMSILNLHFLKVHAFTSSV